MKGDIPEAHWEPLGDIRPLAAAVQKEEATKMANGKAVSEKEWKELKAQLSDVIRLFGGLLFFPVILLVAIGYGIRAGIIVGTEKFLEMLEAWWV